MGNTFTIFRRHALKRVRRFNIQTRTEKYLEKHKDKPERAPLYDATMREVERLAKEMPDLTEEIKKKDGALLNNLRKVYVTSSGDNKDSFSTQRVDSSGEARYLEAIRQKGDVLKDVPPGKYSMQQALTIMKQYQNNPIVNTPKALAAKFNLEPSVIANITKHVKILDYSDTRTKKTSYEFLAQDLLPSSFQGKDELDLIMELQQEADKRSKILFEKAEKLRSGKEGEQLYIESEPELENLLSREAHAKKEQIYTDLEIYRKTGKLPEGPKLIEGRKTGDLSIEDIKKLTSGESDQEICEKAPEHDDKKSDEKNPSEDKQKAAN